MVILIKALQVILSLSLLIFLHELGHFMWAKLFGIRVEKFYLFFDAGGKSIAKWKWGETEFGIGWLPFGGYCKIAGNGRRRTQQLHICHSVLYDDSRHLGTIIHRQQHQ